MRARGIVDQLALELSREDCSLKALVKSQSRPGLWLEDVPEPSIGINDVLMRVHLTGICGTDLHIYQWDEWPARTIPVPMVVGHEFVGDIGAVGSNGNDFHPVDVARHAGARHVVITDPNPHRLELARKVAVTLALDPTRASIAEAQKKLGMLEGFDVGLEMSGNASAFREMLANMSHGAKIAMLGIPAGEMAIDWNTVIFSMLTIKGIYGREMYETWYKMTVMLECGLDITPVITHRFSCADYEEAFAAMLSGQSGKVILNWRNAR